MSFRTPIRRAVAVVAAVAAVTVAAACGDSDTNSGSDKSPSGKGFPVSIKNTFGTTTIKSEPKRIVTLGWNAQDVVYALGKSPVGMPKSTYGAVSPGIAPYDQKYFDADKTTLLDTQDGPPYEKIASLRPDVILAPYEGFDKTAYDKLSKIAPTVAYPGKPWQTSWQDQTTLIGKALGKSAEAKKLVAKTDARVAKEAKAHPEFKGKSITVGAFGAKSYVYLPTDPRVQILNQLGFTNAPGVKALQAKDKSDEVVLEVTKERVGDFDADVVVAYTDDIGVAKFEKDPVFSSLSAVKNGSAYALDDTKLSGAMSAVSAVSIPWMLDRTLPALSKAAKNAK